MPSVNGRGRSDTMGNTLVDAIIVLMISLFAFYILEVTWGLAIDQMVYAFMMVNSARPGWTGPILTMMAQTHKVLLLMVVVTVIWVVRTIVVRMDYSRQQSW